MGKGVSQALKSLVAGGTCGNMMTHVEVWWDEIKYSVCPRPFMRPREARWVREG